MTELEQIILTIIKQKPSSKAHFDNEKRKACGRLKISQPSNRKLISAYQNLVKKKRIKPDPQIELFLRKATIRTLSGVAIITSLTKPFRCPGNCVYCPTEKNMPKSYLATEPAAARALSLDFSPYEQMKRRIEMLEANGHKTDKIEFIVKGGTWNTYPLKYQYWFILESFRACNNLSRRKKTRQLKDYSKKTIEQLQQALAIEQSYNEGAKHRIIGLTLETRPDAVNPTTIYHMRMQGCTRIELGLQATDDKILKLTKRGHTVQDFKNAILLLREAGFKVDLHFMPMLPGSNPKKDVKMYKELFSDPALKPDMVKIYPCTVIKGTELMQWMTSGKYKPYSSKKLFEALIEMKTSTPHYARISRLIRDIPSDEIEGGNIITNLRENLKSEMDKRGLKCKCLRCREVGHLNIQTSKHLNKQAPKLFIDRYETVGGDEYFLSLEDGKRQAVYAFLRLRIPDGKQTRRLENKLPETRDTTFIRELHTYGQLLEVGEKEKTASQHKGMGKKLMTEAEKIAKKADFEKIAVISGVGVRGYYRKLGYKKQGTYMVKSL